MPADKKTVIAWQCRQHGRPVTLLPEFKFDQKFYQGALGHIKSIINWLIDKCFLPFSSNFIVEVTDSFIEEKNRLVFADNL